MEDNEDGRWKDPSPWHPITDPKTLKFLGKLGEETCELGVALFRTIIQGVDEVEPDTKKPNRLWIQQEIADCRAGHRLLIEFLKLDEEAIAKREEKKRGHLLAWHDQLPERPVKAWIAECECAGEWQDQIFLLDEWPEKPTAPYIRNVRPLYE